MIDWKPPLILPSTPSTQDYLINRTPPLLNTVVTTHHQEKGRGTHQKAWISEPGDLVFSFSFLHQKISPSQLVMMISLSLLDILGDGLMIKPPNDLLINQKKCGGILIEQKPLGFQTLTTVGIGVNLIPKSNQAYSHVHSDDSIDVLIARFQESLNTQFKASLDFLFKRYQSAIFWKGLKVFYQAKEIDVLTLFPDFTCETSLGIIPMAHLNFEII
jgi:biotin-[acetyl-CoA-carboxylase] ligase BirA-like protein